MKNIFLILFLLVFGQLRAQSEQETYPVDPASQERADVPKGEVLKFLYSDSKIFPGTTREINVYVPRQYTADKPACVYVNQDGIQWNAPTVFDNLIAGKEMPITIGVFVTPGKVPAKNSDATLDVSVAEEACPMGLAPTASTTWRGRSR